MTWNSLDLRRKHARRTQDVRKRLWLCPWIWLFPHLPTTVLASLETFFPVLTRPYIFRGNMIFYGITTPPPKLQNLAPNEHRPKQTPSRLTECKVWNFVRTFIFEGKFVQLVWVLFGAWGQTYILLPGCCFSDGASLFGNFWNFNWLSQIFDVRRQVSQQ